MPASRRSRAAIADDIAYNAHDIDDALRARLLDLPELVDVPLVGPIVREVLGPLAGYRAAAGRRTRCSGG